MYGAYLLAVYDPDTEAYQTICKIGTGFSEEELEQLTQRCAPHIIDAPKKYYAWHENLLPDVWLDAAMVGWGRAVCGCARQAVCVAHRTSVAGTCYHTYSLTQPRWGRKGAGT